MRILLTLLMISFAVECFADTETTLIINKSQQDGKHLYNAATVKVTTSLIGANITAAIGWTSKCPDSYDGNVSNQKYFTLTRQVQFYHQWLSEPTGWVNKWVCNKTYACIVDFKAIGLANFEASGTILGSGASISMQGATHDLGDATTYMQKQCSELPCTTER